MSPQHPINPGSRMSSEEWDDTAKIRRELVASLTHYVWSKMTVDECDEAVRAEARKRAEAAKDVGAEA